MKVDDLMGEDIKKYFNECIDFIKSGEKTLVHCAGISLFSKNKGIFWHNYCIFLLILSRC